MHGGRDPGLKARINKGRQQPGEAARLRVVAPGDGDGLVLEGLREGLQQVGRVLRDVSPEEQAAVQRLERGCDLLHEVEIDRSEAARVHVGLGLAHAEVNRLVRADVQERAGVLCRKLGELLFDEREGAGLAGREDRAVRRLGQRLDLLPQELVVQMAEGLLLGHDGDVVEARVGDERGCVRCADAAAGRREQRVRGIGRRVLKVRRVEVDLVGSDGADEFFLEIERGDGAAREVVVEAAIFHRRPVANRCGVQDSVRAGAGDELFHRLQRVEDARVAGRGEGEAFAVGNDCVALGLHLAGHFGWRRAAALRCRAARGRFAVDRLCQRRAVSRDQNVDRARWC